METEQLKAQLAEAIRAGNYEEATSAALDLIEQLEQIISDQEEVIKRQKIMLSFGRPDYDRSVEFRKFQEGDIEDPSAP